MVAIFTGLGAGAERGSGNVLGRSGLLGSATLGRSAEQVLLNAATGNLMIQQKDEMLVGLGPDASIGRTYNSLGDLSDENADNWRQSTDRRVYGLTGTQNALNSTVKRVSADGSEITYTWDTTKSAYVAKDGSGAYDTLTWNAAGTGSWTWTNGDSQLTETYGQVSGSQWLITKQTDTSGNALTFSYVGATSHLDKVTITDTIGGGTQYLQYSWSGNNITQITTNYKDLVSNTAKTLTRTRYTYDASNRLSTVTVDLSPGDNSVTDGKTYTTTYTYVGATDMVSTITETDGSSLTIGYDGSNRVHTLTQAVATGVSRVTTIDYYTGYSTVTDAAGQVTRLDYDANDNLTKITAPAALAGLAPQVTKFTYDATGNVTSVVDPLGNTTTYAGFTTNGVATIITDPLGNVTTRTYGSKNELLTETVSGVDQATDTVTTTANSHTTRYVYDGNDRLAFEISADGNVVEHRYDGVGRETLTLTYVGKTFDLNANPAPVFSDMNGWVTNLSQSPNDPTAVNQRLITYDARGNLLSILGYGKSTAPGTGSTANGYSLTNYVYDQAGQLLSCQDYSHGAETFVYDGLGRVVASVDLQGSTTSILFDDINAKTIVTLANGLTQTSTYNKAGDLIASTRLAASTVSPNLKPDISNTSQWALSGLSPGTDGHTFTATGSAGNLWAGTFAVAAGDTLTWEITVRAAGPAATPTLSDALGFNDAGGWGNTTNVTATILSGPGTITVNNNSPVTLAGLQTNADTRIRVTRTFSTASNVAAYFYLRGVNSAVKDDAVILSAPNIVKTSPNTQAVAATTTYDYDQLGRVRVVTDATSNKSYMEYDAVGRKIADIDQAGNVVEYKYDADNRIIATVRYATALSAAALTSLQSAPTTFDFVSNRPADTSDSLWTFSVYDKDGRTIETIETADKIDAINVLGKATAYSYDASGKLTGTTVYANKLTATQIANLKRSVSAPNLKPDISNTSQWALSGLSPGTDGHTFTATGSAGNLWAGTFAVAAGDTLTWEITVRAAGPAATPTLSDALGFNDAGGWGNTTNVTATILSGHGTITVNNNSPVTLAGLQTDADTRIRVTRTFSAASTVAAYFYLRGVNSAVKDDAVILSAPSITILPTAALTLPTADAAHDKTSRIFYDNSGRVVGTLDGEGNFSSVTYDAGGFKIAETAFANKPANGATASFNTLIAGTSAADRTTHYVYNNQGLLCFVIDAQNHVTEYVYPGQHLYDVIDKTRQSIQYAGTIATPTAWTVTAVRSAINAVSGLATNGANRSSWAIYDDYSEKLAYSIDAAGAVTGYKYDAMGNVIKTTRYATTLTPAGLYNSGDMDGWAKGATVANNADNRVTRNYYDGRGDLAFTVDGEGYVTRYDYDAEDRQVGTARWDVAVGGITDATVTADIPALIAAAMAAKSPTPTVITTATSYDMDGRVSTTTDGEQAVTSYVYNANGTLKTKTEGYNTPDAVQTYYVYDAAGRVVSRYDAYGSSDVTQTQFSYDTFGQVTSVTDPVGNKTYNYYDRAGHVVATLDAENNAVETSYNAFGDVTSVIRRGKPGSGSATAYNAPAPDPARDAVSKFYYDTLGRVVRNVDADGYETDTAYTVMGDVASVSRYLTNLWPADLTTSTHINSTITGTPAPNDTISGAPASTIAVSAGGAPGYITSTGTAVANGQSLTFSFWIKKGSVNFASFGIRSSTTPIWGDSSDTAVVMSGSGSISQYNGQWSITGLDANQPTLVVVTRTFHADATASVYLFAGTSTATAVAGDSVIVADVQAAVATTTKFTYDADGRLLTATDALNQTETYTLNAFGERKTATNANNMVTTYTYDRRGLLKNQVGDSGSGGKAISSSFSYDVTGRQVRSTDALNNASSTVYDRNGRVIQTTDALSNSTYYTYDSRGNLVTVKDALNNITRRAYDKLDRLIYTVDPLGNVTQNSYDGDGRIVATRAFATPITPTALAGLSTAPAVSDIQSLVAANNNSDEQTHSVYDGIGRQRYSVDPGNFLTEYRYDARGNVIRRIAYSTAISATATYTLQGMAAQVTAMGSALAAARTTRNVYSEGGKLTCTIDALGGIVAYTYDAFGNTVKEVHLFTPYDGTDDPTDQAMATWVGAHGTTDDRVTRAIYDQDGQLRFAIDAEQYVTEYTYDAIGNVRFTKRYADKFDGITRLGKTYPAFTDSTTLTQAAANVATTASAPAAVTERQYDTAGRLTTTITAIDAVTSTTTFLTLDKLGRAVTTVVANGSAQDASVTTRTFDAVGHVTSVTRAPGQAEASTTTSRYDALGRLTGTLDGNGSVQLAALGSNPTQAQIDNVYAIYGTTYGYDAAGNVVTTIVALDTDTSGVTSAVTTKAYDAFGNVVKLVDPRNNVGYFYYDALDRLVLQIDPENYATATTYTAFGKVETVTRYAVKLTGPFLTTTKPAVSAKTGVDTDGDAVSSFKYDKLDHVTDTTQIVDSNPGNNILENFHYNVFGDRETATSKLGSLTTNLYDKRGLLISETMQVDATATITNKYTYDARGNKTSVIEAYGQPEVRTTTFDYYLNDLVKTKTGDLVPVLNADNLTTTNKAVVESYQYDLRGNLIKVTDANNASSYFYYDDLDRKVAEISAVGTLTTRKFDASGNVTLQSVYATPINSPTLGGPAPDGTGAGTHRDTQLVYGRGNRLKSTTVLGVQYGDYATGYVSGNITTRTGYDAAGNAITQTDGRGNVTYIYYNKLGQKIAQVDTKNYMTTWDLDHNGNVKKETRFATQLVGTPLTVTAPDTPALSDDDRVTTFLYDLAGRRVSESRLKLQASSLDANGLLSTGPAVSSTITYSYNALGQVLRKTEANGDYSKQDYDRLGRVNHTERNSFVDYRGVTVTPSTDLTYNGLGEVVTTTAHGDVNFKNGTQNGTTLDRTTVNTYGKGGRLTSVKDATDFVTSYSYDAVGNVVAQTYGRKKADGSTENDGVFIKYDAAGRETSRKSGVLNGTWAYGDTTDEYYNAFGEIYARGTNTGGDPANAQEFAEYDNAGRVWRTNFNDGVTKVYGYDQNGNATLLIQANAAVVTQANLKSYANLDAILADKSGGYTLTFSKFDARNQLTDTIQPASNNSGPNPVFAQAFDTTGSGGTTYFQSSANPASTVNRATTGAAGSSITTGIATPRVNRSSTISVNWSQQASGQSLSARWTVNIPADCLIGAGRVHIFYDFFEDNGLVVQNGDGSVTAFSSGSINSSNGPFDPQYFEIYQEVPDVGGTLVDLGSVTLTPSEETITDFRTATTDTPATLLFQSETTNATSARVFARPAGSTGPYTEFNASQLQNKDGQNVAGWYSLDLTQSPFNGLAANSGWDIRFIATDASGKIWDSQQGTVAVDASGKPNWSFTPQAVGGPGQAMLTNGNGHDLLILSGLPTNAASGRIVYRAQGTNTAWSTRAFDSAAAFGQPGLRSVDVTGLSGPIEYWVELFDTNGNVLQALDSSNTMRPARSFGTFTVGGQASTLTQFTETSRDIVLSPGSSATVTYQRFRYFANGAWSQWFDNAGNGSWPWNASALTDFYSDSSYQIQYEAYNGSPTNSPPVAQASGKLNLGYHGQSVTDYVNAIGSPAKVIFNPQQTSATKLILYWRDKGTTGAFNASTITKGSDGVLAWNIDSDPGNPRPTSGSRLLEYYYDAYASDGSMLAPIGGDDHVRGLLTLNSDSYVNPQNQEIRWSFSNQADPNLLSPYLIRRSQSYNAFGEIASEVDGNSATTSMSYNTLGELTKKVSPQVSVTDEAGNSTLKNPTETYYYDISGRLIGKRDANSNLLTNGKIATQTLLAGSGHGGDAALSLVQYNPDATLASNSDASKKSFGYDIFGDLRVSTNELQATTSNTYDRAGRLVEVDHPIRVIPNAPSIQLKDYYTYDGLGQRITHSNSVYAGQVEKTDYDNKGRITKVTDFGGLATSYAYTWNSITGGLIATAGLGNFGGWQTKTTNAAGLSSYENDDIFGHVTWRQDFGGHTSNYAYDLAGNLVHQTGTRSGMPNQSIDFAYYTNGYVASVTDNALGMKSTFAYDNEGNRTRETYNSTDASPRFYQNADIKYDALGRMKEFNDAKAVITYNYDANGNRREVKSVYNDGLGNGVVPPQDYWYKYDSMNRFTLTMGTMSNGTIVLGSTGVSIGYDAAGNRHTATYGGNNPHTEVYGYTADGYLETMSIGGVLRAKRTNDELGRVKTYEQFTATGSPDLKRQMTYDFENRIIDEIDDDFTNNRLGTTIHNDYKLYDTATAGYTGADQGVLVHTKTVQTSGTTKTDYRYDWWDEAKQTQIKIGATDPSNPNSGDWAAGYTKFTYDSNGHLTQAIDTAGNRVMTYQNDAYGQVLVREEKVNGALRARQLYYYFDGHRIGDVGNDGVAPSLTDYAQALAVDRNAAPSNNGFRYGKPVASADFDENFQPINASYPGDAASTYTVRAGDTLQTIAQTVWGDSSLWYLIADTNGLTASTSLVAGQTLQIPNKVTNFHNNTGTYRVYNPGEAIGDTLPTLPPEPAPPAPKTGNKCGAFGQILLIAIAVAVTIATHGALAHLIGAAAAPGGAAAATGLTATLGVAGANAVGGALAAVAGSLVSQAVGVATGIQSSFSWKGVALAAIGGAVGGSLIKVNAFGTGLNNVAHGLQAVGNDVVRGALGSAISQGVGVATGLQKNFDWVSVAAAGIGAGVGGAVGRSIGFDGNLKGFNVGNALKGGIAGAADSIAEAATRSLIQGSDFGDNVLASLPSVIGNTIGNLIGNSIASGPRDIAAERRAAPGNTAPDTTSLPAIDLSVADEPIFRPDPSIIGDVANLNFGGQSGSTLLGALQPGKHRVGHVTVDSGSVVAQDMNSSGSVILGDEVSSAGARIRYATDRDIAYAAGIRQIIASGGTRVDVLRFAKGQGYSTAFGADLDATIRARAGGRNWAVATPETGERDRSWGEWLSGTPLAAGVVSAANVITLGGLDEGAGTINSWLNGGSRDEQIAKADLAKQLLSADHPIASVVGGVAGAVLVAPLLPEVATASGTGILITGVASGGIYGYLENNNDRSRGALIGAVSGPFLGLASRAAAPGFSLVTSRAITLATNRPGILAAERITMNSGGDRLIGSMGSASLNNAAELDAIVGSLRSQGVDISFREGQFAYGTAASGGRPGNIIFDPDGSISAIRHEYGHFLDDQALGFPGTRFYYENPSARVATERSQYLGEIRTARQLGDQGARRALIQDYLGERNHLIENYYTKPYGGR